MKHPISLLAVTGSRAFVLASLITGFAATSQALIVNFDSASSITDNFSAGGIVASGSLTYSSSAGLNGGGGAVLPGGTNNNFIYSANQSFSPASLLTISTYLKIDAAPGGATNGLSLVTGISGTAAPQSALGWGGASTDGVVGVPRSATGSGSTFTTPQYSLAVSLRYDAAAAKYNLVSFSNGSNAGLGTGAQFSLTAGNWYYWSTTYTFNSINLSYTFSSQLFSASADGTVGTAVSGIYTQTVINSGLAGSSSIYGILASQAGSAKGVASIDNFAVVPEPGSMALLGMGMLGLVGYCRLRSRK